MGRPGGRAVPSGSAAGRPGGIAGRSGRADRHQPFDAALIMAMIPARIASGRSQASMTAARRGSERPIGGRAWSDLGGSGVDEGSLSVPIGVEVPLDRAGCGMVAD